MSTETPKLLEISEVKLFNTDQDADRKIKKIDFEGNNIWEHPDIEKRRNNGWVIQGVTAVVQYDDDVYTIAVSAGKTMSYAKVENAINYTKGQELMDFLRSEFLSAYRQD